MDQVNFPSSAIGSHTSDGRVRVNLTAVHEPEHCQEKQALIKSIRAVIHEILAIHTQELESVVAGDFTAGEGMQTRLSNLRELKALFMERYKNHVFDHGCSKFFLGNFTGSQA